MLRFLQLHCSSFTAVSNIAASLALPDSLLKICCSAGYLFYLSLNKALALPVTSILHTLQKWAQVTVTCSLSCSICAFHSCAGITDIVLCCIVEDGANAMLAQHVSGWLQSELTFPYTTKKHTHQSVTGDSCRAQLDNTKRANRLAATAVQGVQQAKQTKKC